MPKVTLVVPCYNEARRLRADGFQAYFARPNVAQLGLLFVDDGSTDDTAGVLDRLCASLDGRGQVLRLPGNRGKAEAVRQGMLYALRQGADVTGYADADLATPPADVLQLVEIVLERRAEVALAARVRLLGARIDRRPLRHYLGRVFATLASLALRLPVYDTQCGAKLFARTPALDAALAEPFLSRWAFDVELLGRLCTGARAAAGPDQGRFMEVPVRRWEDVRGSKVRFSDIVRMGLDLVRIALDLRRRRLVPTAEAGARECLADRAAAAHAPVAAVAKGLPPGPAPSGLKTAYTCSATPASARLDGREMPA